MISGANLQAARKFIAQAPADNSPVDVKSPAAPAVTEPHALKTPAMFEPISAVTLTKAEVVQKVDELANGMVLLGISTHGAEQGWLWLLEGTDHRTLGRSHTHDIADLR